MVYLILYMYYDTEVHAVYQTRGDAEAERDRLEKGQAKGGRRSSGCYVVEEQKLR
jgi:hypothetical protein